MKNSRVSPAASAAVAEHDQHAAPEHRALLADQPVGDPATEQRQQVGRGDVQAVDRVRGAVVEAEAALGDGGGHEQDQDRAHAVVGEALPHLRDEQRRESARLAEELRSVRGIALDALIHRRGAPSCSSLRARPGAAPGCLLLVTGMLQRCASLTEERAPGQEAADCGHRVYTRAAEHVQPGVQLLALCSSLRCCARRSRSRMRDRMMPTS